MPLSGYFRQSAATCFCAGLVAFFHFFWQIKSKSRAGDVVKTTQGSRVEEMIFKIRWLRC